ncbi:hypothetical protein ACFV2S_10805 [Streptomyces sp. NPDC059695]|uniref:hypothetical protein n=1 Tax=Streptomyces sp. NPDC059695 TaxID=3346910 RepID=UPI0036AC0A5F
MSGETELTSAYTSKVAGDLERNVEERERIRGEIDRLTAELEALDHDHAVLLNLQKALQSAVPTPDGEVPRQRSGKDGQSSGTGRPTLVELIRAYLAASGSPCSAREVTTALSAQHSDRHVQTTVVRTSLESLVARGEAQRAKQGSSVFYTSTSPREESER